MLLNLFDPVRHVFKAVFICAVVCKDDSHCALIVSLRNGSETFLTCCIPDLEFHILAVDDYGLYLEIDA